MMSKSFPDRRGGHKSADIAARSGHTAWTPRGRRFVKRITNRELRREQRRITAEALLALEDEANADVLMNEEIALQMQVEDFLLWQEEREEALYMADLYEDYMNETHLSDEEFEDLWP